MPHDAPWTAAKILLRPVAELRPHAGIAPVHRAEQHQQIKASMVEALAS